MCYMESITHREMRNQSAEILRRVASGETLQVTNNGHPTALLVPAGGDALDAAIARGEARPARLPVSAVGTIRRRTSPVTTAAIISDTRGRW